MTEEDNKNMRKEKLIEDLMFLTKIKRQSLGQNIHKYVLEEGIDEPLSHLKVPISVMISFDKYDYEGHLQQKNTTYKVGLPISDQTDKEENFSLILPFSIIKALESMRVLEVAWLVRLCRQDYAEHFKIKIDEIQFKDANNYEAKIKVCQQKCDKAKTLWKESKYPKAAELYRSAANYLKSFPKTFLNTEQHKKEVQNLFLKAKINFLRCFIKPIVTLEWEQSAKTYGQQLLKKKPDALSYYLNAAVLRKRKYVTDALGMAKKALQLETDDSKKQCIQNLIKQIQEQLSRCK